ncbi:non-ribosomal peptide synthetase [Streptomyces sp. NPDC046215]|uniref:non-ribosomal peptide synthetase n=1 Tax=Streptomyces sp. NPDC046215 TaxID=3155774 RepID=UPI0033C63DB9
MQHRTITTQYLDRFRDVAGTAGELLPVTGAQRRFLLARRMDPSGRAAVVPLFFTFPRGSVDLSRLRSAAGYLAALHPALRARPVTVRGVPALRAADAGPRADRVVPRPGESAADALRRTLADWPAEGPPLRLFLAAETAGAEGREILAVAMDHAACDEASLGRVLAGLTDAYRDALGPGDVTAVRAAGELDSYREAVHLQLAAEARASGPGSLAYWSARAAALRPAPAPRPAGSGTGTGAARHRLPLATDDSRATAFPVLLDACAAAARTLHGADLVPPLGYPWGGRPAGAPPALGCFLNTVLHPATAEGLTERTTSWWDDLDHADTPFDEVVHAARTAGAAWPGRLDGLLTFEDLTHRPPLRLGDATGCETHLDGRPLQAPFAVSVSYGSDLLVRMAWDRNRFADHLAEHAFDTLLATLRTHTATAVPVG